VYENSELKVENCIFEHNFSKDKGAVICGDYQNAKIEIENSTFY